MLLAAEVHVSVASELLLRLAHQRVKPCLDIGQTLADMAHEGCVERLGQELRSASGGNVSVCWVVLEKIVLGLESLVHGLVALDILLRAVYDTDETQLEGVDSAGQDVESVGAMVHQVEFCENTNCSSAEGINMAGEFESL